MKKKAVKKQKLYKIKICCDCSLDISGTGSRKIRCNECQHKRLMKIKRDKRKELWDATEHLCKKCGGDISERKHHATVCWACRRKKQAKTQKIYNSKNKKMLDESRGKYKDNNEEKVRNYSKYYRRKERKLNRKMLKTDLPKEEPRRNMWVEWDDIPRCEGFNLAVSYKNKFGEPCSMRAKYRLKDKYDGLIRFVCQFHLKGIGRLCYYNIEELDHQTIIRRETKLKWKKIQEKEIDKKRKIRNGRIKRKRKNNVPMPYQNSHIPINGSFDVKEILEV